MEANGRPRSWSRNYQHLAPNADFKIDPTRRRRIAKVREAIRKVEELK
jgi:hypothetical protein